MRITFPPRVPDECGIPARDLSVRADAHAGGAVVGRQRRVEERAHDPLAFEDRCSLAVHAVGNARAIRSRPILDVLRGIRGDPLQETIDRSADVVCIRACVHPSRRMVESDELRIRHARRKLLALRKRDHVKKQSVRETGVGSLWIWPRGTNNYGNCTRMKPHWAELALAP